MNSSGAMVSTLPRQTGFGTRSQSSLAGKAYDWLVERLLNHRLVPGMLLNRREIANELKMSVAPVLEAMVQLESEGFLESVPRKGTLVKAVRLEDLRGQLILREALECEAARYYCGEPIGANEGMLLALAEAIDGVPLSDRDAQWLAEYDFHLALIETAGIPALAACFRKVMQRKLFMALNVYLAAHAAGAPRDSHVRLLGKLKVMDPDEAENAIRIHLRNEKQELFARRAS